MARHELVASFVETVARHDGFAPFSDAKLPAIRSVDASVIVAEEGEIVGVGAVAAHEQSDGTVRWGVETVVLPSLRFPAFEGAILDAGLSLLPHGEPFGVWSNRSTLDTALSGRGFEPARVIHYLTVGLPLSALAGESGRGTTIRTFEPRDVQRVVEVNNAAFEHHKEASSLSEQEMIQYMATDWFTADGLLIAESDGLTGFCWTKVHANGDGEIFRIAVEPGSQEKGIGFALLTAGFAYLAERSDVRRGTLWTEESNVRAMDLYQSVGLTIERSNKEFSLR